LRLVAKVSTRRKIAGLKNLTKAHATRVGRRGMHYKPRQMK